MEKVWVYYCAIADSNRPTVVRETNESVPTATRCEKLGRDTKIKVISMFGHNPVQAIAHLGRLVTDLDSRSSSLQNDSMLRQLSELGQQSLERDNGEEPG